MRCDCKFLVISRSLQGICQVEVKLDCSPVTVSSFDELLGESTTTDGDLLKAGLPLGKAYDKVILGKVV